MWLRGSTSSEHSGHEVSQGGLSGQLPAVPSPLPHPAPGRGTLTEGRWLQFCTNHKLWCSGCSRANLDPARSCRGFLNAR